jgi:hypothetical protein
MPRAPFIHPMSVKAPFVSVALAFMLFQAGHSHAQDTKETLKAKLTAAMCPVFEKAVADPQMATLSKTQYMNLITQGFAPVVGKEMATINRLYGAKAFGNAQIMNQIGSEVGAQLLQECPAFVTLSQRVAEGEASTAATTGQTLGTIGTLGGTDLARLQVNGKKGEKNEFVVLNRFTGADEMLPKLSGLQGRQARISWQETDVYQPQLKRYEKVREITAIELL